MFNNKSILITDGTGSFGKKYTEILLSKFKPKRLVIYSHDELKQYEMAQVFKDPAMRFFIGDVRDEKRLMTAMNGIPRRGELCRSAGFFIRCRRRRRRG